MDDFLKYKDILSLCFLLSLILTAQPSLAAVNFNIQGTPSAGALEIQRVELVFDNGFTSASVAPDDNLKTRAILRYRGNGLLRAKWTVDGRIIEVVNLNLSSGSILNLALGDNVVLPTIEAGRHTVKLFIETPTPKFQLPEIRYNVVVGSSKSIPEVKGKIRSEDIKSATVFYRTIGSEKYDSKKFIPKTATELIQQIPESYYEGTPGIEYYAHYLDKTGREFTEPSSDPENKPFKLIFSQEGSVKANLLTDQGAAIPADKTIKFSVKGITKSTNLDNIHLFVNEEDHTGSLKWSGNQINFDPIQDLTEGQHYFVLTQDIEGQEFILGEFDIDIAAPARSGKNIIFAKGNASIQAGATYSDANANETLTANLGLAFGGKQSGWDYKWNGINSNYNYQSDPKLTLTSGFTFTANKGEHQIEYGDISVNESSLTVSGFSRRGIQYKINKLNNEVHVFNIRTEAVQDFSPGVKGNIDQEVVGASYDTSLLGNDKLKLKIVGLTGGNQNINGAGTAGVQSPSEGSTLGVELSTSLTGYTLSGEFAFSQYNPDTINNPEANKDTAMSVSLGKSFDGSNLSFSVLRYGSDYATIANPNFSGDRQGVTAGYSTKFYNTNLTTNYSYTRDNVANDVLRPVVSSNSVNIGWGLALPDYPSLQLSYGLSRQSSTKNPDPSEQLGNLNHNVSTGISYAKNFWNTGLTTSVGYLDDTTSSNQDSGTAGVSLNLGIKKGGLSISPAASYNISRSGNKNNNTNTTLASVSTSFPLFNDILSLSGQTSFSKSTAGNGSESESVNGSLRLNSNTKKMFSQWFGITLKHLTLSVSANVNSQKDISNNTNNNNWTVLMSIGYSRPIGMNHNW